MNQLTYFKVKMICNNCQKEIKENAKFCIFCGAKQILRYPVKKDYSLLWIILGFIGVPLLLFIYISYLHSQGSCIVIGPRGSTSEMTCDGLDSPFKNFIFIVGTFVVIGLINPILNFLSNLLRKIFKSK